MFLPHVPITHLPGLGSVADDDELFCPDASDVEEHDPECVICFCMHDGEKTGTNSEFFSRLHNHVFGSQI